MIRVAVFGGDGRGYLVERVDEKCVVTAYEGDASNAERVAQATRQGSFTHVVALQRWMNHSQWHKLRDVCKETKGVTFVTWPRGLGSLNQEIESWIFKDQTKPFALLGKEAKDVTRGKAEEIWLNDNTVHVLSKEEAMQEFGAPNGVSGVATDSTATTEKKDFRGVTAQIRETFAIDPRKEWTTRALCEFLYSTEDNLTMQVVAAKLRRMELMGEIRAVGGIAKSATNPRRFVSTASTPEAPETPEAPKKASRFPANINDWRSEKGRVSHSERIVQILTANASGSWTVRELAQEIFGNTTKASIVTVRKKLKILINRGRVRTVGERKSQNEQLRYGIDLGPSKKVRTSDPTPIDSEAVLKKMSLAEQAAEVEKAARTLASLNPTYLIIDPDDVTAGYRVTTDRSEALAYVSERPEWKLFREVKLRVTVEIDE